MKVFGTCVTSRFARESAHGVPLLETHSHRQGADAESQQIGDLIDLGRKGAWINIRDDRVTGTSGIPGEPGFPTGSD